MDLGLDGRTLASHQTSLTITSSETAKVNNTLLVVLLLRFYLQLRNPFEVGAVDFNWAAFTVDFIKTNKFQDVFSLDEDFYAYV